MTLEKKNRSKLQWLIVGRQLCWTGLRFQLSRCLYMYVFLSTSKVNLCFSNENAMTDFRKTWYVPSWTLFGPLVPLSTSRHFQLFLKKICLTVSKCFHVSTYKSFAYYQLHRNKSKFLDYISESFLRKGISWIVGNGILPFPVYMILECNSMNLFGYSICVWRLKMCIFFVWKYENVIKLLPLRA